MKRKPSTTELAYLLMQDYREKVVIPYSQYGRKIYYKKADITAFFEANYHKAKEE